MKIHRYNYIYLPMHRFVSRLSPQTQLVLVIGKVALIVLLVGFDFAHATNLI